MSASAPSILDDISSVQMLEMLITNDSRWSWVVTAWAKSSNAQQRDLAKRVRAFRADFLDKTAKLTLQLLGDISSPDDVQAYLAKAQADAVNTTEPIPEREPEPEPDGAC